MYLSIDFLICLEKIECMVNGQNGDGTEQGDCPDNTLCQKTGDCLGKYEY